MPDPRRNGFQNKFWKGNGFLSSHTPMFEFNNVGNKNMEAAVGSCASIMIKNKRGTSFVGVVSNLMFPHWDNRPNPERLAHRSELPGIGVLCPWLERGTTDHQPGFAAKVGSSYYTRTRLSKRLRSFASPRKAAHHTKVPHRAAC